MNVIFDQAVEIIILGLLVLITALLLLAAVSGAIRRRVASSPKKTLKAVTFVWYVDSSQAAEELLVIEPDSVSMRYDEVFVCVNVDTTIIRKLRAKYAKNRVNIYSPKANKDLQTILKRAYERSYKGEIIAVLYSRPNQKNIIIDQIKGLEAGEVVRLMPRYNKTNVLGLVGTYVSVIRNVCYDAYAVFGKRTVKRQLEVVYNRSDFVTDNVKAKIRWKETSWFRKSSGYTSFPGAASILVGLSIVYALAIIVAGLSTLLSMEVSYLAAVWVITILLLLVASIGNTSYENKTAALLALPLAPILLLTYVLLYPYIFVLNILRLRSWQF